MPRRWIKHINNISLFLFPAMYNVNMEISRKRLLSGNTIFQVTDMGLIYGTITPNSTPWKKNEQTKTEYTKEKEPPWNDEQYICFYGHPVPPLILLQFQLLIMVRDKLSRRSLQKETRNVSIWHKYPRPGPSSPTRRNFAKNEVEKGP